MASPAGSTSQEYWRPSNPEAARVIPSIRGICRRCGMDYSPGARYCHLCGGARVNNIEDALVSPEESSPSTEAAASQASRFGLSVISLVCLGLALTFAFAALLTGALYKQETLADWQAIQLWRIEWLLAAAVALLAGNLFKKS